MHAPERSVPGGLVVLIFDQDKRRPRNYVGAVRSEAFMAVSFIGRSVGHNPDL